MNDQTSLDGVPSLATPPVEAKRPTSYNNHLILETYEADRSLQSVERNGLAFVKQKVALVGLRLLVDAQLNNGTVLLAGSKAYIKESLLHTQPFGKDKFESDALPGQKFTIVDFSVVEMVVP